MIACFGITPTNTDNMLKQPDITYKIHIQYSSTPLQSYKLKSGPHRGGRYDHRKTVHVHMRTCAHVTTQISEFCPHGDVEACDWGDAVVARGDTLFSLCGESRRTTS